MNQDNLNFLKEWFSAYCRSFYSSNAEDQKNIILKEDHTYKVCDHITRIAMEQSLSHNDLMLAQTVALFHDVGIFSQYKKYRAFNDRTSVNHGKLGAEILEHEKILERLPEHEQAMITNAVRFHNAFAIPSPYDQKTIFLLKLIRDADKLDILRVFIEYYEGSEDEKASATALGLPDTPDYSEDILSCLHKEQIASYSSMKTLNDFRLIQLSWIYDLNFKLSFRLLMEGDYINRVSAKLPQTEDISNTLFLLKEFVDKQLR